MKSIFVLFVLFFSTPLFAQSGLPEKDPRDPSCRWSHAGRELSLQYSREAMERREQAEREARAQNGDNSAAKYAEIIAAAHHVYMCDIGENAGNTPAEKMSCFREALKTKDFSIISSPEDLKTELNKDPVAAKIFNDVLEGRYDALANSFGPRMPEYETGLQISPSDLGLTHCNFSAISSDGRTTDFKAANYNQENTQKLVDNLRVIDPRAEIYFNDPKIVGAKQDNDHTHDGTLHVAWSSDALSPAGMKLLLESNPIVVGLFLELAPSKQDEALEEYKTFDFTLVKEYIHVGAPAKLQAALRTLQEKKTECEDLEWARLIYGLACGCELLKTHNFAALEAKVAGYPEKKRMLEREQSELLATIAICALEYLATPDPLVVERTIKAIQENERAKAVPLNPFVHLMKADQAVFNAAYKVYYEWEVAIAREKADFNCLMECAKNQDLVALMTYLKVLEEKLCEPSEAQRRKEYRQARATERLNARYEPVRAKLRRLRQEAWDREQQRLRDLECPRERYRREEAYSDMNK